MVNDTLKLFYSFYLFYVYETYEFTVDDHT